MRVMLGNDKYPSLLVSVVDNYDPTDFSFWVVNGLWPGHFTDGHISVNYDSTNNCWAECQGPEPWSKLNKLKILTDNQDRLRGDYRDVFNNFDNPDYVAPMPVYDSTDFDDDDDIPF